MTAVDRASRAPQNKITTPRTQIMVNGKFPAAEETRALSRSTSLPLFNSESLLTTPGSGGGKRPADRGNREYPHIICSSFML